MTNKYKYSAAWLCKHGQRLVPVYICVLIYSKHIFHSNLHTPAHYINYTFFSPICINLQFYFLVIFFFSNTFLILWIFSTNSSDSPFSCFAQRELVLAKEDPDIYVVSQEYLLSYLYFLLASHRKMLAAGCTFIKINVARSQCKICTY